MGCRAAYAPMKANIKLLPDERKILDDPGKYRWLVGKLNYLIVSRSNISFVVSVLLVSQFLSAPRITHWDAIV